MGECEVDGINVRVVNEGLVVEVDLIGMVCLGERRDMSLVTTAYRNETRTGLMKNPFYNGINYGVYFLCFLCMKIKSPPSYFTLIILTSTLVYSVVALILVYKYAPKTFRVK